MKIAIDCRMYLMSGIGTYIREILPYLLKTENKFLLIGTERDLIKYKNYDNVEIIECNIKIFTLKEMFLFPVDKINLCDIYYTPFYNIPLRINIPIYSTIHDVIYLDMPELTSKIGFFIRKFFLKRSYNLSKKIFTVSKFSKNRIENHFGKKKKVIVTYNGVSKYILDDERKIYNKKNYIIYVGNIKKHKGLKILLMAYLEARKLGLNKDLVIVGNQKNFRSKDEKIIKILENLNNSNIRFTGYVDNTKLKELIGEASVLVQPSLYEGFGIPPLEALALKTRAIVSDIDVFKEIYKDMEVEYFQSNNIESLKNKLLNDKKNKIETKISYTYKSVSEIVINNLEKRVNKNV